MTNSAVDENKGPRVEFDSATVEQIRRHAHSSMEAEICGVLVGTIKDGITRVQACIAGENADQGGAHVTFTQETWQHIYRIKDAEYADSSIVGWYHSHPGFGIFLSDYDVFIHKNFFTAPHQIAWVFDPHSESEDCFGWVSPDDLGPVKFSVVEDGAGGSDTAKPSSKATIAPETVSPAQNWEKYFLSRARSLFVAVARAVVVRRTVSRKHIGQADQGMPKPSALEKQTNTTTEKEGDTQKASSASLTTRSQRENDNPKGD